MKLKLECKDCGKVFVPKPTDIISGLLLDYSYCPECNNVVLVDTSQVKDDKC